MDPERAAKLRRMMDSPPVYRAVALMTVLGACRGKWSAEGSEILTDFLVRAEEPETRRRLHRQLRANRDEAIAANQDLAMAARIYDMAIEQSDG